MGGSTVCQGTREESYLSACQVIGRQARGRAAEPAGTAKGAPNPLEAIGEILESTNLGRQPQMRDFVEVQASQGETPALRRRENITSVDTVQDTAGETYFSAAAPRVSGQYLQDWEARRRSGKRHVISLGSNGMRTLLTTLRTTARRLPTSCWGILTLG